MLSNSGQSTPLGGGVLLGWGPRVSWHQLYRQSDNSHFGSCRSDTSAFTERSSHIWVSPCLSSCILCLRPLTSPHLAHHSLVRFPASLAFGRASGLGNLTMPCHAMPIPSPNVHYILQSSSLFLKSSNKASQALLSKALLNWEGVRHNRNGAGGKRVLLGWSLSICFFVGKL